MSSVHWPFSVLVRQVSQCHTEHPDVDGKPSLVASGAGNQLTVHNQQLWDSFVAKGQ